MLTFALLLNILMYIAIIGLPILGISAFIILKLNKKIYICGSCGEKYKFEQMKAKSCSVCGGKLIEVKRKDVNSFKQQHKINIIGNK